MTHPAGPVPFVRDVSASFAFNLALIADRLTIAELQAFIDLGTVINERMACLMPPLRASGPIDKACARRDLVFAETLDSPPASTTTSSRRARQVHAKP